MSLSVRFGIGASMRDFFVKSYPNAQRNGVIRQKYLFGEILKLNIAPTKATYLTKVAHEK